ncbi:MAG: hypothetical protein ACP5E3_10035, partial [Bacteroidales bacterium]
MTKNKIRILLTLFFLISISYSCKRDNSIKLENEQGFKNISGIYPHLAMYNNEDECGTGAVVPWANRLWVITYGPHLPMGSSDKLYEITPDLQQIIRPESIGGTPANRMIHKESAQLFIGPYAIDTLRNVRAISYEKMPGRHTGNARHLSDPENMIYYVTMEEGFYEVNVHSLDVNTLYPDANGMPADEYSQLLPGAHGKGLYSGQGVLAYSNNGEPSPEALIKFDIESGVLAEWNGDDWKIIFRNQFVEVTGPGGIYGNPDPDNDPLWATGWDHKSAFVSVRDTDSDSWELYRIPKASHSYDGAHGWNTEWPRIRNIGSVDQPYYLMTMHGMFWEFPGTFNIKNTAGLRPLSSYLKVIGDFARWNGQLVFGCDDSAQKEFLNKRSVKGNIEGPGQSNSNLWFTSLETPGELGPSNAGGAVWLNENIPANNPSEAFLFAGWSERNCWIQNEGGNETTFRFETDETGKGSWENILNITIPARGSKRVIFHSSEPGEWIRVSTDKITTGTVFFSYSEKDVRDTDPDEIFSGISLIEENESAGGLLYGLGDNQRTLGISAYQFTKDGKDSKGYYELNAEMELLKKDNPESLDFIDEHFAIPQNAITIDSASVLIIDDSGRRWRLPKGDDSFTPLSAQGHLRIAREVATERDLFNCHGTFYELPAENADGFAKIRPISSHNFRIHDYASYRGMLIMTGINPESGKDNPHIFRSDDGMA